MKKLITAGEVCEGDLIRLEYVDEEAVEGRAYPHPIRGILCIAGVWPGAAGVTAIYLLDRPAPPKIPADAEYVTWVTPYGGRRSAHKMGDGRWGVRYGLRTLDELLEIIGDAEVTVLVPKEGQS